GPGPPDVGWSAARPPDRHVQPVPLPPAKEAPRAAADRMKKNDPEHLLRWQVLTVLLMVVGYAGYYLCRSDFSVALPLIIKELAAGGLDPADAKIRLGAVASLATLAYAIGKFLSGGIADFLGGRRNFLM